MSLLTLRERNLRLFPGVDGVNSRIVPLDPSTGEFKKFVKFGTQALSMENDEARDLVYVTDFGTGKIAIFDAKTDRTPS